MLLCLASLYLNLPGRIQSSVVSGQSISSSILPSAALFSLNVALAVHVLETGWKEDISLAQLLFSLSFLTTAKTLCSQSSLG